MTIAGLENGPNLRIPLYVQVREKLREELATSPAGTMIPPEAVLEERFKVSRITIRKAIDDLVSDGLLVRKQGRGTFRHVPKIHQELNTITSWTRQMVEMGYTPRTAAYEVAAIRPPKKISHLLQLKGEDLVIQLKRTRLANDEPITLMVNYLPEKLLPGFASLAEKNESLYETVKLRYGLSPASAVDTVETRQAAESESERLHIELWAPVLVVTRVAYLADGQPFEVSSAVSCGDRYEYRVHLHRGATS